MAFLGAKSLTFSSLSKVTLYPLKVRSSIAAPFKDILPTIFWFSNWILSLWPKASSLEVSVTFSFWSILGASPVCSILFCSAIEIDKALFFSEKKFLTLHNESLLESLDDSYESFKNFNISNIGLTKSLTANTEYALYPHAYTRVIDPFRADYEETLWGFNKNSFRSLIGVSCLTLKLITSLFSLTL